MTNIQNNFCSICGKVAKFNCINCGDLCEKHIHNKGCENHKVIELNKKHSYCPIHKEKYILYCSDHNKCGCSRCGRDLHNNCNNTRIFYKIEPDKTELENCLKSFDKFNNVPNSGCYTSRKLSPLSNNKSIISSNSKNPKEKIISSIIFNNSSMYNSKDSTSDKRKETVKTLSNQLNNFLKEINMEKYCNKLYRNGFDDINLLIEQTKSSIAITIENLYDIGLRKMGDCSKILLRIEEKAGLFPVPLNKDRIYLSSDRNSTLLMKMLSSIKMEKFISNFLDNGYTSPDLLYALMLTRQPITKEILKYIGISKVGYQMRILNKLRTESALLANKIKNNLLLLEAKKADDDLCNMCLIY